MNWLDELIARIGQQQAPAGPDTTGYTSSVMYDRGGPYYTPSPDPWQFEPPYRAPYGDGQMIQESDLTGRPAGNERYSPRTYEGYRSSSKELFGRLSDRANTAYPQGGTTPGLVDGFNYNNMLSDVDEPSAVHMGDARLRAFMRAIAEDAAIQQQKARRGGGR